MIVDTYGTTTTMKKSSVYACFNIPRKDPSHNCMDQPRSGRPHTASGKNDELRELLQSDRRLTIDDISFKTGISPSTVHL